jgi:hypothetical protein
MKKLLVILFIAQALISSAIDPIVRSSGMASKSSKGKRTFGIGVNYTFPAPGLSAKFAISEKLKLQGSFFRRVYDYGFGSYSWSMYGLEADYCFKEDKIKRGSVSPFVFVGGGRGVIDMSEIGDYEASFWAYNIGGGLEWYPKFLQNNLGITWKLGYGSIGGSSEFGSVSMRGILLYGFAIHYYIK